MDEEYTLSDLARETRSTFIRDCEAFLQAHEDLIGDRHEDAGHDLWLTRNGHGAGFWDGDWPEPAATKLTEAAKAMGEVDLLVEDHEISAA